MRLLRTGSAGARGSRRQLRVRPAGRDSPGARATACPSRRRAGCCWGRVRRRLDDGLQTEAMQDDDVPPSVPSPVNARRTVRDAAGWLRAYQPESTALDGSHPDTTGVLWGWWHWSVRQALAVVRESEKTGGGAVSPLVRSVSEHVHAMLWLSDGGPDAAEAVWSGWDDHRVLLYSRLDDEQRSVDAAPTPPAPAGSARARQERALFASSVGRLLAYEGGDPASVYGALSALTHPTLATATAFAVPDAAGAVDLCARPEPTRDAEAAESAVVHVALLIVLAARVFHRAVPDPVLNYRIGRWADRLGVLPEIPARKPLPVVPPPDEAVQANARQALAALDRDAVAVRRRLQALAEGTDTSEPASRKALQRAAGRLTSSLAALAAPPALDPPV